MSIRKLACLSIGAVLMCCASVSQAAVVTYNWTGNITTGAAVGGSNTITGTFSYDNAATSSSFDFTTPTLITFTFGNLSGSVTGNHVAVFNDYSNVGDQFDLRGAPTAYTGSKVNGLAPSQFFLRFNDVSKSAFSNALMPVALDPTKFTFADPYESRIDGWNVAFVTTGLSANAVPEPGSLAMFGLGAVAVGASRRKKRTSA